MDVAKFTSKRKGINNYVHCAVENCGTRANKNPHLSYHTFPRAKQRFVNRQNLFGDSEKVDIHDAWKKVLKISNVTKKTSVCSLHFKKTDYLFPDIPASKRYLKKTAVPSCNLPDDEERKIKEQEDKERLERRLNRNSIIYNKGSIKMNKSVQERTGEAVSKIVCKNRVKAEKDDVCSEIDATQFLKVMLVTPPTPVSSVKDQEVQVNTECLMPNIMRNLHNKELLSNSTGLESLELLDTIVQIVKKVTNNKFENLNTILNTRDRVIMTYVKLKENISYSFLAIIFNCYSSKHCEEVIHEMIMILSKCLKVAIPWPSKGEISRNLPKSFEGFENVRVVLNCIEVLIEDSGKPCCETLTYSRYKNSNTAKVMTGASPSGIFTFVSKVYGGRATNTDIFQQSGLINLLQPGDGIMVDHGFLINRACKVNKWKCIRPPFLNDKAEFTKEESLLTSKIDAAREHIEQLCQKIKTFKVLGTIMPLTLVPFAEEIFTVICGTMNMSTPILKDDKFMDLSNN